MIRTSFALPRPAGLTRRDAAVTPVLFLCLFAAQAAVIALSPVLTAVADDFDVSTAAAGQLRTVSGLAAAATALAVPLLARRSGLRTLLLAGTVTTAGASLASAAATSFAMLVGAQVLVGVGVAILVAAGTTAAAEWVPEARRAQVLSWALIGQPAAWVVGMPLIGALGDHSWRLGWLALPFVAAGAAAILVARQPADESLPLEVRIRGAFGDPAIARWAIAELLANSGWAATLVYAGALFADSYGTSTTATGVVLAVAAIAYIAGNMGARRVVDDEPTRLLVVLASVLAIGVALFGMLRPGLTGSTLLFSAAAAAAGARTLIGNAAGLRFGPSHRLAAMSVRAATMQFGYFIGAAASGIALARFGYAGFGLTAATFFAAAAFTLARLDLIVRTPLLRPTPCAGCPT